MRIILVYKNNNIFYLIKVKLIFNKKFDKHKKSYKIYSLN
jgi:hypothetical protein